MQTIDLKTHIYERFCCAHATQKPLVLPTDGVAIHDSYIGRYQVPLLSSLAHSTATALNAELTNAHAGLYQLECTDDINARFADFITECDQHALLDAYHVISDHGLFSSIAEMQFTARLAINLNLADSDIMERLFSPQSGAIVQILPENVMEVMALADTHHISDNISLIGQTIETPIGGANLDNLTLITPHHQGDHAITFARATLQQAWQSFPDSLPIALQEQALEVIHNPCHHGLTSLAHYDFNQKIEQPYLQARIEEGTPPPQVAIICDQLADNYQQLHSSFALVGFTVVAVSVHNLLHNSLNLRDYDGLVVADYHSEHIAQIYDNDDLRMQFVQFFHRPHTFTLAIGNGCQALSQLKELIPHADHFPDCVTNISTQYEQRTMSVRVENTKSIVFKGMQNSIIPTVVATQQGRMNIDEGQLQEMVWSGHLAVRAVDSRGYPTEQYPLNPTGSLGGVMGVTSNDGRVTMLMVQPEYGVKDSDGNDGAWLRMFRNAMAFLR